MFCPLTAALNTDDGRAIAVFRAKYRAGPKKRDRLDCTRVMGLMRTADGQLLLRPVWLAASLSRGVQWEHAEVLAWRATFLCGLFAGGRLARDARPVKRETYDLKCHESHLRGL